MVDEFADRHRAVDGLVEPPWSISPSGSASDLGQGATGDHAAMGHSGDEASPTMPPDVFLLAERWYFLPDALRLRRDVTYRFTMMAADVSHGASFQLGIGGHIIRLRRGVVTRRDLAFTAPGEYLLYCTVYCGVGHDQMIGKIIVV
jgi:heme/copper-type cytochrome/quinol oxidase subunit 2